MATYQEKQQRIQQQRENLKRRLENHFTKGELKEAQQLAEKLVGQGHKSHVIWALQQIKHPDAQKMLKKLAASSEKLKPQQKTGTNRLPIVIGGLAIVLVFGVVIGGMILSRINQPSNTVSSVILEESVNTGVAGVFDMTVFYPAGWLTSKRIEDPSNGETILIGNSQAALDLILSDINAYPTGDQVIGYIKAVGVSNTPHEFAASIFRNQVTSDTTINGLNAAIGMGTRRGSSTASAKVVVLDTTDRLIMLYMWAPEGKLGLFENILQSMAQALQYSSPVVGQIGGQVAVQPTQLDASSQNMVAIPSSTIESASSACASSAPDIDTGSVAVAETSTYDIPNSVPVSMALPAGWVARVWEWGQAVTFASKPEVLDRGANPLTSGEAEGSVTVIIKGTSDHPSMPAFGQFTSIDELLGTMPPGTTEVNRVCVNGNEAFISTSDKTDARGTESQMAGFMDAGDGFIFLLMSVPGGELAQYTATFNAIFKSIQINDQANDDSQPAAQRDMIALYSEGYLAVSDLNGDNFRRLAEGYEVSNPVWSADGTQIIFSTRVNSDIFTVDIANGVVTNLTNTSEGLEFYPSLSPDGEYILFQSLFQSDDYSKIRVMDSDGKNVRVLSEEIESDFSTAAWSPDGTAIAFLGNERIPTGENSFTYGLPDLFVMNSDGSNLRNLTNSVDIQESRDISWSPDGSRILYTVYNRDTEKQGIFTIKLDGSSPQNLTNSVDTFASNPMWSSDGETIVFVTQNTAEGVNIFVMNADGSDPRRLTTSSETPDYPSISPDGKQIAYIVFYTGVYLMNTDGTNPRLIIPDEAGDISRVIWQPLDRNQ